MENSTLLSTTRIALQNFLQIWKQDPLAQQTLCISPQNIFICNPEEPDQITDITNELEEPNTTNITEQENNRLFEEFVNLEFNIEAQEESNIPPNPEVAKINELTENLQELYEDLTQPLKLIES